MSATASSGDAHAVTPEPHEADTGTPEPGDGDGSSGGGEETAPAPPPSPDDDRWTTVVRGTPDPSSDPDRAGSRVSPTDLAERLPRSAPDALRYEPGVFVQQTAASQGSAFIRGRTGQQTVLLFDGIRLNNSLYRQGPNQYFFTLDSKTIRAIEVIRGSASVRHGSDAVGGVLDALPIEAPLWTDLEGLNVWPRTMLEVGTADDQIRERFQLEWQWDRLGFIGGVGYRSAGLLEGGGAVVSPRTGETALVPRLAPDGRTQLGTGFDERTFDVRLAYDLGDAGRLVGAVYGYRQVDAPRTDRCPPAHAPADECLRYDEQFRTLAYLSYRGDPWPGRVEDMRLDLSVQRQHERRSLSRPSSFVQAGGRDDVDTFGVGVQASMGTLRPSDDTTVTIRWGGDAYHDRVSSAAWVGFTDVDVTIARSRGQYLEGSHYTWGGLWIEPSMSIGEALAVSLGGRLAAVGAHAPSDPASGTAALDATWWVPVGRAGVVWRPLGWLAARANIDHAFRAPNLDDLTSRQQTGPGFQFENPDLAPEQAVTVEAGLEFGLPWLRASVWGWWTPMWGAMARAPREASDCPPGETACAASWNRFQLVNLDGRADMAGVEVTALVELPWDLALRTTLAWTWGEGPNPAERPSVPGVPYAETVPLSRVPPLNGTVELRWRSPRGLYAGAGLRWATLQDRLAPSDWSDPRIPVGGTPGFAVLDVRAGWRYRRFFALGLVFENVTDAAYRYHGSSVNGPGFGVILNLEVGL